MPAITNVTHSDVPRMLQRIMEDAMEKQKTVCKIASLELSAAWPSGSEHCFCDGHDRGANGSTPTLDP